MSNLPSSKMDKFALFRIFLYKILKEYKFSWLFKLFFLVLIPITLICTYLNISHYQETRNVEFDPIDAVSSSYIESKNSLILVLSYQESIYFVGGEEDKLFYYPETNVTVNIIEELREKLEIVASSKNDLFLSPEAFIHYSLIISLL